MQRRWKRAIDEIEVSLIQLDVEGRAVLVGVLVVQSPSDTFPRS
jgi:hypothetical protein